MRFLCLLLLFFVVLFLFGWFVGVVLLISLLNHLGPITVFILL